MMQQNDFEPFRNLVTDVSAFYGKDLSPFALDVWWNALKRFELAEIQHAFSVHCQDPDRGQWMPKPADVIRVLDGTSCDRAASAWSKVDKAVRMVGPYRDVVFDDPIIHAVIADMGGWISLCNCSDEEWPFRANEFQRRYQGHAMRNACTGYPRVLTGIANAHNMAEGHRVEAPVLIGDKNLARDVYLSGADLPAIQVASLRSVDDILPAALAEESR